MIRLESNICGLARHGQKLGIDAHQPFGTGQIVDDGYDVLHWDDRTTKGIDLCPRLQIQRCLDEGARHILGMLHPDGTVIPNVKRFPLRRVQQSHCRIRGQPHIAPRPVDRPGPQSHTVDPIIRVINPRHLFCRVFEHPIKRRGDDILVLVKCTTNRRAINGCRRGQAVVEPVLAQQLQKDHVRFDVHINAAHRVGFAQRNLQSGQVDNTVKLLILHQGLNSMTITHVQLNARQVGMVQRLPQHQLHPLRILRDVPRHNLMSRLQQQKRYPASDAARRARNQYLFHCFQSPPLQFTCRGKRRWLETETITLFACMSAMGGAKVARHDQSTAFRNPIKERPACAARGVRIAAKRAVDLGFRDLNRVMEDVGRKHGVTFGFTQPVNELTGRMAGRQLGMQHISDAIARLHQLIPA